MTIKEIKTAIIQWRITKERIIYLSIGLGAVLVYEFIARPYYRPYIYKNKLFDFHIADTLGNTLGTVATIFVFLAFIGQGRLQHLFLIKTITLSIVLFELAHQLLGKHIDPWDILASIITGTLSFYGYKLITNRVQESKSE